MLQIISSLSSSNQIFAIRRPIQIVVGNRKGSKFTYTCSRNGRNTTVLIIVFVENKKGYTITYVCASILYRQLRDIAFRMLNSFTILNSEEDSVDFSSLCLILENPRRYLQQSHSHSLVPVLPSKLLRPSSLALGNLHCSSFSVCLTLL